MKRKYGFQREPQESQISGRLTMRNLTQNVCEKNFDSDGKAVRGIVASVAKYGKIMVYSHLRLTFWEFDMSVLLSSLVIL